eukprot:4296945-Alexandrium_andersonii.AAC.1
MPIPGRGPGWRASDARAAAGAAVNAELQQELQSSRTAVAELPRELQSNPAATGAAVEAELRQRLQ